MKHAVILHGTDGTPESNWFPWLKAKLEVAGYEVWVPQLPDCHMPNRETYGDFLLGSDFDFADSIVVGHSSGAVEVLNLLMDQRCPKVKLAVAVSAWAGGKPNGYETNEQFEHLFPPDGFDFERIKVNAGKLQFVHSSNDPYCPLDAAKYLAEQTGAPLTIIENGIHLGSNYTEFPQLWQAIEPNV